ncbi:3141_t:CDS:1, partial [Paraglomus brasilianum]
PFQRALPTARTNLINFKFYRLTQFTALPDNLYQQSTISTIPVWKPSRRLHQNLLQLFNDHYNQFTCLHCVYCGQLLYPEKAALVVQEDPST